MLRGGPTRPFFFFEGNRMNDADFTRLAASADLCRLLAACYYQPGPEFAEEKLFDSMVDAAARLDDELTAEARRLRDDFASEDPQELLIDYTRLFLGPIGAPAKPYGSVWLDGRSSLMQESTLAVQALYAEGGFELGDDFHELPDHIAAEMEFLYLLLFRQAEACTKQDADELTRMAALQRRLLDEHLGRWIEPFTTALAANAQTAFYRGLAGLTRRFVEAERTRVQS
jgi:putative dimethyl sulfoxide reductase chaperone